MTAALPPLNHCTVAVIGLGYVGLPLAVEFAKPRVCCRTGASLKRRVIGFDINSQRLEELRQGIDRTNETSVEDLHAAQLLEFTSDPTQLAEADVFVVTVPTPIDSAKRPDLTPLEKASATVGRALKSRAISGAISTPLVIYESTVYPGATEEICVPILEYESGLTFNQGFCCGYSPERINPGDKEHRLTTIIKVTSGSSPEAASWIDSFYASVIRAGTHLASSLKVAEAAKVIENTQRDLNIALVNELAMIFRKIGIDTLDVLEASGTKWNFLPFKPGLVGGHCISVDPYYLTHKAQELGYYPEVLLAGRRINDGMGKWIISQLVLDMARKGLTIAGSRVLILGVTFKEDCPDFRNTRVLDLVSEVRMFGMKPFLVDPCIDHLVFGEVTGLNVLSTIPESESYDAVIVAVAHQEFKQITENGWKSLLVKDGVFVDIKGILPRSLEPLRI